MIDGECSVLRSSACYTPDMSEEQVLKDTPSAFPARIEAIPVFPILTPLRSEEPETEELRKFAARDTVAFSMRGKRRDDVEGSNEQLVM